MIMTSQVTWTPDFNLIHMKLSSDFSNKQHSWHTHDNDPLPESGSHDCSLSTPDPKHRDVAMRLALLLLWFLAEKDEMDGLIKCKVCQGVKRSSLNPEDHIFTTRFHYKIKSKNVAFELCKVRLVVQGHEKKGCLWFGWLRGQLQFCDSRQRSASYVTT